LERSLICILAVFAAVFIAIFLSFVIEFVRKIKANDPERFAQITNELRLFRLGSKKRGKARCDQGRSREAINYLLYFQSVCLVRPQITHQIEDQIENSPLRPGRIH
jgi:hypothetical protein